MQLAFESTLVEPQGDTSPSDGRSFPFAVGEAAGDKVDGITITYPGTITHTYT